MFSCNDELALEFRLQSVSKLHIGTLFVPFGPLKSSQQSEVACRIMDFARSPRHVGLIAGWCRWFNKQGQEIAGTCT